MPIDSPLIAVVNVVVSKTFGADAGVDNTLRRANAMSGEEKAASSGSAVIPGIPAISAAVADPAAVVEAWFRQLAESLKGKAVRDFGCVEAEAEDLVHDVFQKAITAVAVGNPPREKAWFYTVMRNLWINKIRKTSNCTTESLDRLLADGVQPSAAGPNPYQSAVKSERVKAVHECLAALSERHRTVIELTDLGGLSGQEAAEIMGLVGAIFGLQVRARRALRACLAKKGYTVEASYAS